MTIIYVGWASVIVLAMLGILGAKDDIADETRGRKYGPPRR